MIPSIISRLFSENGWNAMRERIANVRYAGFTDNNTVDCIAFTFDGVPHRGELRGRNRELLLGFGEEKDKAIALRVLLDNHAEREAVG